MKESMKKIGRWLYKYAIESVVKLAKIVYEKVNFLGWLWGILCVLIAGIIFYLPSIILFILNKPILAWGYALWWLSPAFSPATLVYLSLLSLIIGIACKIKGKKIP